MEFERHPGCVRAPPHWMMSEIPPLGAALPLSQVQGVVGVENVGVARLVGGHADYRDHMGDVLDAVALTGV